MRQLKITNINVLANDRGIYLIGVKSDMYEHGKLSDTVQGQNYVCILPGNDFEKITIKTPELIPSITQDEIEANGNPIPIDVIDFRCTVYVSDGKIALSCKAKTIVPLEKGVDGDERIF